MFSQIRRKGATLAKVKVGLWIRLGVVERYSATRGTFYRTCV